MSVLSPDVIGVFRLEDGLNIHAHIGEVIENPHNRVAKLHGYALRLARAVYAVAAGCPTLSQTPEYLHPSAASAHVP